MTVQTLDRAPRERQALTVREVADLLGLSPWTVWRYIREGRIRPVRLGTRCVRIARAEIDRLLRGE